MEFDNALSIKYEGDKSETEIGACKPIGSLSHLQYKNAIFVST